VLSQLPFDIGTKICLWQQFLLVYQKQMQGTIECDATSFGTAG